MKTTLDALPNVQATGAAPSSAKEAERLQLLTLVQQFEGMLLTEMLRDVRAGDDEDEGTFGLGGSATNDMMQSEFGAAISRAGGLGMGDMLAAAFARQKQAVSPELAAASLTAGGTNPGAAQAGFTPVALAAMGVASANAATTEIAARTTGNGLLTPPAANGLLTPAAAEGLLTPAAADGLTLPQAAVTSAYGWRNDPLNGQLKFHKGTDLRMAYGTEVTSAAPGVVVSAGEQQGYGLTVVVDHGEGRETRYAHLSAVQVSPGETVGSGQPIARSGNSGRTTGPHLHFEAREYGRPVDPRLAAELWTGRKSDTTVGESDDSAMRY